LNILVLAASEAEILPLKNLFGITDNQVYSVFRTDQHEISFVISGIGTVATTFVLTRELSGKHYDLAINIGIAGSYQNHIPIGEVVRVESDEFADWGIETPQGINTLFEENLIQLDEKPFQNGCIANNLRTNIEEYEALLPVKAITANVSHGAQPTIEWLRKCFAPDIETMEGAAFFYVVRLMQVQGIQIRSISNFVEPRNRSSWNIPLAVNNLTYTANNIIRSLLNLSK
jgi:futalosine hydrolase